MKPTARDLRLLRALNRGETPRGSVRDLERLIALVGQPCLNREHPLHESPFLTTMQHRELTKPAEQIIADWLVKFEHESK